MKIIQHEKFTELKADEGKIIVSKTKFIDEDTGEEIYDVSGYSICLGIYDSVENYDEIDDFTVEEVEE